MKHNYRFDHKKSIIFLTFHGQLYVKDFEDGHLRLKDDPEYNAQYSILIDIRDCAFKSDSEEIKTLVQLFSKNIKAHGIKHAILVDNPLETAMAVFYQEFSKDCRTVHIFCTHEAAMEWLFRP